jgi:hypothetical protein
MDSPIKFFLTDTHFKIDSVLYEFGLLHQRE